METFGAIVSRVVVPAMLSFLFFVCIGSFVLSASSMEHLSGAGLWDAASGAVPIAFVAGTLGVLPTLLVGVPAYAALFRYGYAGFFTSAILGALPGIALVAVGAALGDGGEDERALGLFFVLFGVPIAVGTHLGVRFSIARRGAPN